MIQVDPTPRHDLSPGLFMQFMEPLGATDASVEACWSLRDGAWREDFMEAARELAPTMLRWGGCLASYYKWQEAVGPMAERTPLFNLCWGGVEPNLVGTHEFLDLCRRLGAEGFFTVNFESDGRRHWMRDPRGSDRCGTAAEAAAWVAYCNDADHADRRAHGVDEPFDLKLWQIGNETSYPAEAFDAETAARKTAEFARAMREADPSIELIGWGQSSHHHPRWAAPMLEAAGEHLRYLAFHVHPGLHAEPGEIPIRDWRLDPATAWARLMQGHQAFEREIEKMRRETEGADIDLAMTEGHFNLRDLHRGDVLHTWAAGLAYARCLHVFEKHGDRLKIATLADFAGTRWSNNAIFVETPHRPRPGGAWLMPVAHVMSLYRHHRGRHRCDATCDSEHLDVAASGDADRVVLHVVNTSMHQADTTDFAIAGRRIVKATVHEVRHAPFFVCRNARDAAQLKPRRIDIDADKPWTFPPASCSAVVLETQLAEYPTST